MPPPRPPISSEARYRIHAVAKLTGTPAPTLRAWERRYGIPLPDRTDSRYRLYSDADVALVRQMQALQTRGLAPSQAARALLNAASLPASEVTPPVANPVPDANEAAIERILAAIFDYNEGELELEIGRALQLASPASVYVQVLAPALVRVGEAWVAGALDIAAEHLATQVVTRILSDLVGVLSRGTPRPRVLLACVSDEQHELPLLGVALALLEADLRPVMLGGRTPPTAIAAAVGRLRPSAVALSVTVEPLDPLALFADYGRCCASVPWFVGGPASASLAQQVSEGGGQVVTSVLDLCDRLASIHGNAPTRKASRKSSSATSST